MSLPTPPRQSTRKGKENSSSPLRSVEWAADSKIFVFSPADNRPTCSTPSAGSSKAPRKSILKAPKALPPAPTEPARETTPLPDDAASDPTYLNRPVSVILDEASSLRERTEAYAILAARIRASLLPQYLGVDGKHRASYPLFQPFRTNAAALASAIARDLGRVFVDPMEISASAPSSPVESGPARPSGLPSPRDTPSPKKGGMNEEQVKYARDLCTVTNATIKFVALALSAATIYKAFSEDELHSILTALLEILMAKSLRSPSARKIFGFAIGVLHTQRLPPRILKPAKDRIMLAIRRALEGEYGREGKKGAVSDALKAVHELSQYQPDIFVPGFASIISPVLELLLAPQLTLRVQAAHALGGLVLGITKRDQDRAVLDTIASAVSDFVLRREPLPGSQPGTTIIRTLRATLKSITAVHHAQGPFWALSVLASLIVLAGPELLRDRRLLMEFRAVLELGLSQKKILKVLTASLWGPLLWVWRARGDADESDENLSDTEETEREQARAHFRKVLQMSASLPNGVAFAAALLNNGPQSTTPANVLTMLVDLDASARAGGADTDYALGVLERLTAPADIFPEEFFANWAAEFDLKLLPRPFFAVSPGLLTTEFDQISPIVQEMLAHQPGLADMRPLMGEERRITRVWVMLKDAWVHCIENQQLDGPAAIRDEILAIWAQLIRMRTDALKGNEAALVAFGENCSDVLISILKNAKVDLRAHPEGAGGEFGARSAAALRLKLLLVRTLWGVTYDHLPPKLLQAAIPPMLHYLVQKHDELVPTDMKQESAMDEWAMFCAQVAACAEAREAVMSVWKTKWTWSTELRKVAWRGYAKGWMVDSHGSWGGANTILALPFASDNPFDLDDTSYEQWEALLKHSMTKATDGGIGLAAFLDHVAFKIEHRHIADLPSSTRVADFLLNCLDRAIEDCSELPLNLIDLVHEVLLSTYPPDPRNKVVSLWLLRSLQVMIIACPKPLAFQLLERLRDGLCVWLKDECEVFSAEEYTRDVVPIYQTVLVLLQSVEPTVNVLQTLSPVFPSALESPTPDGRAEALTSFEEFWSGCCTNLRKPRSGWESGIVDALATLSAQRASLAEEEDCAYEADESQASICEAASVDDDDELDMLPRSSPPKGASSTQRLSFSAPPIPLTNSSSNVTPKKITKVIPSRPEKPVVVHTIPVHSPPSPSARLSRMTTGRRARHRQHARSRSDGDVSEKENVLPSLSSESSDADVFLGKRNAAAGSPRSPKKRRLDEEGKHKTELHVRIGSDDSEAECAQVEAALTTLSEASPSVLSQLPGARLGQVETTAPRRSSKIIRTYGRNQSQASPSKRSRMEEGETDCRPSKAIRRDEASSDDDSSSIGPATPHGPAPHEKSLVVAVGQDLPSDDSMGSSSPIRAAVERKLHRSASLVRSSSLFQFQKSGKLEPSTTRAVGTPAMNHISTR